MASLGVLFVVLFCLVLDLSLATSVLIERQNLRRHSAQAPFYDVVPVLECVDRYNKAYFNYENNAGTPLTIGFSDFNTLTPLNVAPITSFNNGSGPAFPFSTTISLSGFENGTFNWNLQQYYLPFSITPALACPTKFNITLQFIFVYSGSNSFPSVEKIIEVFASLAGISTTRFVTLSNVYNGPMAKRAILGEPMLARQDIELELTDGNVTSTEPTAADVIRDFIENEKQNELNQAIDDLYPRSSNLTIFEPKSDDPQPIVGQIRPPVAAPGTVPTNQPSPVTSPTAAPKSSNLVSTATALFVNALTIVSVFIALHV